MSRPLVGIRFRIGIFSLLACNAVGIAYAQGRPSLSTNLDAAVNKHYVDDNNILRVLGTGTGPYAIPIRVENSTTLYHSERIASDHAMVLKANDVYLVGASAKDSVAGSDADPAKLISASIPANSVNQVINLQAVSSYEEREGVNFGVLTLMGKTHSTTSNVVTLMVDSKGPESKSARVESFPGGAGSIYVMLTEDDLDVSASKLSAANFVITQLNVATSDPTATRVVTPSTTPSFNKLRKEIALDFASLPPGQYTVEVRDLQDRLGNTQTNTGAAAKYTINIATGRQPGKQIEYPEYLAPENKDSAFQPSDRVETRVVRLYYYRDAHRVLQIINRNSKQLNQSGVDQARRIAESGRTSANESTDERRRLEAVAINAATKLRALETEAAEKGEEAAKSRATIDKISQQRAEIAEAAIDIGPAATGGSTKSISIQITEFEAAIATSKTKIESDKKTVSDEQKKAIDLRDLDLINSTLKEIAAEEKRLADLTARRSQIERFKNIDERLGANLEAVKNRVQPLEDRISDIRRELPGAQAKAQETQLAMQQAEAREQRAQTEAFRREVAAGLTDPDTYAAGIMESVDTVTQVTMTVIGEGVIQLRGPIKGINRIRRMIHDIDSPVGQVKVGIHTVQVNGEHGDRMELVYERIDKHIAHSRFLANQSSQLFRKAVAEVATSVSTAVHRGQIIPRNDLTLSPKIDQGQIKYLVAFFGRDFINELCRMDSELLSGDNRLLSLHSMDTLSLAGAMNVVGLADNSIREMIMQRFQQLVASELPQLEYDYYRALTHTRHADPLLNAIAVRFKQDHLDAKDCRRLALNAARTYTYPNTISFFGTNSQGRFVGTAGLDQYDDNGLGALTPLQYATVRLAQSLKAQLVAEMEYKQLVFERSLMSMDPREYQSAAAKAAKEHKAAEASLAEAEVAKNTAVSRVIGIGTQLTSRIFDEPLNDPSQEKMLDPKTLAEFRSVLRRRFSGEQLKKFIELHAHPLLMQASESEIPLSEMANELDLRIHRYARLDPAISDLLRNDRIKCYMISLSPVVVGALKKTLPSLEGQYERCVDLQREAAESAVRLAAAKTEAEKKDKALFTIRMLEQFIDEQEEKAVELLEAMRSHSANIDNYLKRQAIAFEDDLMAQFYNPAFQDVRRASRYHDVSLGQIETTTILTNNRAFAKVEPAATVEFDLPQRDILINEAMKGAKAMATEYGSLMKDGTFLAATSMQSGQSATGLINSQSPLRQVPGLPAGGQPQFGSEFQKLIPDPAIYKFETGTGFEIRPVIQPDGHSIVYDFNYNYTTNVREPVRADEKHLGRVKRHFVHTDVQTSSFELREVSRYTVALKASRTGRGVPLIEDVPVLGAAFRPAPSAESSLQMNVILASSTIYPTQFDLMGLRWSPYADQVDSKDLRNEKQEQNERRDELRKHLLRDIRQRVDGQIGRPSAGNDIPGPRLSPLSLPERIAPLRPLSEPVIQTIPPAEEYQSSSPIESRIRSTDSVPSSIQQMNYSNTVPVSNSATPTNGSAGTRPATSARPKAPESPRRIAK